MKKRRTYKNTLEADARITFEYYKYFAENNKTPSITKLSELTGYCSETCSRHLLAKPPEFYLEPFKTEMGNIFQVVVNKALKGDLKACELYFKIYQNGEGGTEIKDNQINVMVKID